MPLKPYTWQLDDYLTASRLNSELVKSGGSPLQPNGVGFHAARPIYRGFFGSNAGYTLNGAWSRPSGGANNTWDVVADTAGYFGTKADFAFHGICDLGGLANGGGSAGQPGGLGLVFGNTSLNVNTSGAIHRIGLGNTSSQTITGTLQGFNSDNTIGGHVLDIMDLNQQICLWGQADTTTVTNFAAHNDGSGRETRLQAMWASIYPANGTTVALTPAPVSNWTSSSPALTAALLNGNTGIAEIMNLWNMPPLLRAVKLGNNTSLPDSTNTTIDIGAATWDTYSAWNSVTNVYTVPLNGLYLVYACLPFDAQPGGARLQTGVNINGTIYWGPNCQIVGSEGGAAAKAQIFSLNPGDTITPVAWQNTGGTIHGSNSLDAILVVLYLGGNAGGPPVAAAIPDVTYSYIAGTPASQMPAIMNAHLANDLTFLTYRPYLMAYQTTQQTGIPMNSDTIVTMNSITGIVHGDNGDNYSGWGSGVYTAQRNGWYLAVQETVMAAPTLTATPWLAAGFDVEPHGSTQGDLYQQANVTTGAGGGAAAIGMYYLRTGDTIAPLMLPEDMSAGNTATTVGGGRNSHFELVWVGE